MPGIRAISSAVGCGGWVYDGLAIRSILGEAALAAEKREVKFTVKQAWTLAKLEDGPRKKRLCIEFEGPPEPDLTDAAVLALDRLFGGQRE